MQGQGGAGASAGPGERESSKATKKGLRTSRTNADPGFARVHKKMYRPLLEPLVCVLRGGLTPLWGAQSQGDQKKP